MEGGDCAEVNKDHRGEDVIVFVKTVHSPTYKKQSHRRLKVKLSISTPSFIN